MFPQSGLRMQTLISLSHWCTFCRIPYGTACVHVHVCVCVCVCVWTGGGHCFDPVQCSVKYCPFIHNWQWALYIFFNQLAVKPSELRALSAKRLPGLCGRAICFVDVTFMNNANLFHPPLRSHARDSSLQLRDEFN